MLAVSSMVCLTSCYNNKADIIALPKVSFVNEIAPILTSGACGCHNNGGTAAKQFSNLVKNNNKGDTVYYNAIYSESKTLENWANGVTGHPGGGTVDLSAAEKQTILNWVAQGAPDDQSSGGANGSVTYSGNIAGIISSTCSGGTCHGGVAPTLNYASLTGSLNSNFVNFVNSNWNGHGGGTQSPSITATLKAWIAQGMPQ